MTAITTDHPLSRNKSIPTYTHNYKKGQTIKVKLSCNKYANGVVLRVSNEYADVQVNNKEYLVDGKGTVISQIK